MGPKDITGPPYSRERKYRCYNLECPVHVAFPVGNSLFQLDAVSKNVSVGGLLLEAPSQIATDCPVSFTMTISGGRIIRPIQLPGEGRVVRVQPGEPGARYAIAVEFSRPLMQI